jgi:hypothetical protein
MVNKISSLVRVIGLVVILIPIAVLTDLYFGNVPLYGMIEEATVSKIIETR